MVWVVVLSVNDKEALSSLTTYVLIYHFDESSDKGRVDKNKAEVPNPPKRNSNDERKYQQERK